MSMAKIIILQDGIFKTKTSFPANIARRKVKLVYLSTLRLPRTALSVNFSFTSSNKMYIISAWTCSKFDLREAEGWLRKGRGSQIKVRFKRLDLRFLQIGALLVVFTKRDLEFPGVAGQVV
eukprot:sb/3476133/